MLSPSHLVSPVISSPPIIDSEKGNPPDAIYLPPPASLTLIVLRKATLYRETHLLDNLIGLIGG
jgi:hypothetical protein